MSLRGLFVWEARNIDLLFIWQLSWRHRAWRHAMRSEVSCAGSWQVSVAAEPSVASVILCVPPFCFTRECCQWQFEVKCHPFTFRAWIGSRVIGDCAKHCAIAPITDVHVYNKGAYTPLQLSSDAFVRSKSNYWFRLALSCDADRSFSTDVWTRSLRQFSALCAAI